MSSGQYNNIINAHWPGCLAGSHWFALQNSDGTATLHHCTECWMLRLICSTLYYYFCCSFASLFVAGSGLHQEYKAPSEWRGAASILMLLAVASGPSALLAPLFASVFDALFHTQSFFSLALPLRSLFAGFIAFYLLSACILVYVTSRNDTITNARCIFYIHYMRVLRFCDASRK